MKRKYIALFLSLCITVSGGTAAFAAESENKETLVTANSLFNYETEELSINFDYETGTILACENHNNQSIVLPAEIEGVPVKAIGDGAFHGNLNLKSVVLPDSVESIGNYSFASCKYLKNVYIGSGVKDIHINAFTYSQRLEEINVSENNEVYSSKDGVIYDKTGTRLIFCPYGKTDVIISDGALSIEKYAFRECKLLKSVEVPDSVTSMGSGVFMDCTGLESIKLPPHIDKIGNLFFVGCSSLKNVVIPEGVQYIGVKAFFECTALEEINIPSSVTFINQSAFRGCTSLKKVVLPLGITSISVGMFSGCTLEELTIPSSVVYIGKFTETDSNTLLRVVEGSYAEQYAIDNGFRYEYYTEMENAAPPANGYAVDGGYIYFDHEGTIIGCEDSVRNAVIPAEINDIKINAVGHLAFYVKPYLESAEIAEGITELGVEAFAENSNLTKLLIPRSVNHMDITVIDYSNKVAVYLYKYSYADDFFKNWEIDKVYIKNAKAVIYGDADGDDKLTAADCSHIMQKVLDNSYKTPVEDIIDDYMGVLCVSDKNHADVAVAADAATVLQKILDSSYKFPVEQ